MNFPIHKNETGSFQELAHKSDVEFGQLSILTINPGSSRGDHYHKRKEEWFCCIKGECGLQKSNLKTGESKLLYLSDKNREFIKVEPYEIHTLLNNPGRSFCEVLIIISEEYDEGDPDTFIFNSEN